MSTIFAVYVSGGEYDMAYHNLIKCWSTREAAEQHVRELEDFRSRQKQAIELEEAHFAMWDKENPFTVPYPEQKVYPRWHGIRNENITDIMRAERAVIVAENEAKNKVYSDLREAHDERRFNACEAYLLTTDISKDMIEWLNNESVYFRRDAAEYSIEPVEID